MIFRVQKEQNRSHYVERPAPKSEALLRDLFAVCRHHGLALNDYDGDLYVERSLVVVELIEDGSRSIGVDFGIEET